MTDFDCLRWARELVARELDRKGKDRGIADSAPQAFRIEVESRRELGSREEVWRLMASLSPEEGWLLTTAAVVDVGAGSPLPVDLTPLDGELTLDVSRSVHVRHVGPDGWEVRVLRRVDDDDAYGTIRSFFKRGAPETRVVYEVSWAPRPDANGGLVLTPVVARFAGYERS